MGRRLAAWILVLTAACADGPQRIGASPSWRTSPPPATPPAGPVTFDPDSEPATHYNQAQAQPPQGLLASAVTAAVRDAAARAGVPAPESDARLFRTCTELAEVVLAHGMVDYPVIEFALQRSGIIEPSPQLLIVWGDIDDPAPILKELTPRIDEALRDGVTSRVGVGTARHGAGNPGVVVFALQGSGLSTQPIPRAVGAHDSVVIDAVLDPRYRDPEVLVTYDTGDTHRIELQPGRPGGFIAQVACATHRGREQIEIAASDARGATVLANFPVWCATAPPRSITVEPATDDAQSQVTASEAERRLFSRVNRDRATAGLPALRWDDAVAEVARGYAEEMRRTRIVAHISPTSGSVADRVRAAGIKTGVVLENVARAYGIDESHRALMNSPGHRGNILSGVATQIGIGVAYGDEVSGRREMFIAQVFTRVAPRIDLRQASAIVRGKLAAARSAVAAAASLDPLAQRLADGVAAGKSRDDAYRAISGQLSEFSKRYRRVSTVVTAFADLDAVDGSELLGGTSADDLGLGIAQGTHPEIGDNAIWIVLLLGSRR